MLPRSLMIGLVATCLTLTYAQATHSTSYFGVGLDFFVAEGAFLGPLPTIHFGGEVAPNFELRGGLGGIIIVSLLSGDALYTDLVPDASLRYYLGGGPDVLLAVVAFDEGGTFFAFALHATAGLEYRQDTFGLFAEGQPFVLFGDPTTFGGRFRTGVNFHF